MSGLLVGFSRKTITPELGVEMTGYYVKRYVEGVLDDIEVNTLALEKDETRILIMSLDVCYIKQIDMDILRGTVADAVGIPLEHIYMMATHTHTGPMVSIHEGGEKEHRYFAKLKGWLVEAARDAIDHMKLSSVGWGISHAPNVAFIRRFRMKDGSVQTNPGLHNPNIEKAIGEVDDRVSILRFEQEDGNSLVLVNFANHPDSVGGNLISADWPGMMRRTLERSIPGVKCIFSNGADGDVCGSNYFAEDGELNGVTSDFDNMLRGYKHARHMGNVVAGSVLQIYEKVNHLEIDSIRCVQKEIEVPTNVPTREEAQLAHKYVKLHTEGRDDEIPYKAMLLTTVVAEATRMLMLEHGPKTMSMKLTAIAIGDVAMVGFPGEPFGKVGIELKKTAGWKLIMPSCNTNGSQGYFPTKEAYQEGGYEARSSKYKAGVAELLLNECHELLNVIK